MDLQALIDAFRQRADDAVQPYFVSDEDLAKFASEGEREACIRASLIFDDLSPELVEIPVLANTHTYELDPLILRVDTAEFARADGGRQCTVHPTGMDHIREHPGWQGRVASQPRHVVHLDTPPSLRLWPTPSMPGTLHLGVYRLPMNDMEDGSDEPEIPIQHHEGLVLWMLYRVYSTKDSELYDADRATENLADFTERFGERPSAEVLRRHRERRRVTTPYGGL